MGNGQCEICSGLDTHWYESGQEWDAGEIGHEEGCSIALALQALGEKPIMKGKWEPGYAAPVTPLRVMMELHCQRVLGSEEYAEICRKYKRPIPTPEELKASRDMVEALKAALDNPSLQS